MSAPRVLLWDIETSQNLVAVFQLAKNDYIDYRNLIRERYIICAAWKWLGEKTVHSVSILNDRKRYKKDPHDDRHVVETLHKVIGQADVLVAHNGDRFDYKYVTARGIAHGLPKLPPTASVDTLKIARREFLFNSNRLDYLGKYLNLGKKVDHEPGLWLRVLNGDAEAVRAMVRYNQGDVLLLEKVFLRLRPYVTEAITRALDGGIGCPRCGSLQTQRQGVRRAITRTYARYQCQSCGGWFRDGQIVDRTKTRLIA